MGVIVSRGYSYILCDDCNKTESRKVKGDNDGQTDVEREAEKDGWRISYVNRHATCPECWRKEMRRFGH